MVGCRFVRIAGTKEFQFGPLRHNSAFSINKPSRTCQGSCAGSKTCCVQDGCLRGSLHNLLAVWSMSGFVRSATPRGATDLSGGSRQFRGRTETKPRTVDALFEKIVYSQRNRRPDGICLCQAHLSVRLKISRRTWQVRTCLDGCLSRKHTQGLSMSWFSRHLCCNID